MEVLYTVQLTWSMELTPAHRILALGSTILQVETSTTVPLSRKSGVRGSSLMELALGEVVADWVAFKARGRDMSPKAVSNSNSILAPGVGVCNPTLTILVIVVVGWVLG
ncbi:uncharacterized protein ColSpa_07230 [Colletotrichum spaethianum]|uniref:Uncharacterized protein n=1 Tax=Colletotrichum spaethianum TaxID=700344 RepID=A0AA37LGI9_9PEZI|nr:uncharacterized protein ColSpa_07230 [Colletotrichum spaethianum]GKT47049.1 hypothetical protein ColSpa_07230 [Colletotrichum spaethianum]